MNKGVLLISCLLCLATHAFGNAHTGISGGLSLAIGPGSQDIYPGFNVNLALFGTPIDYFGVGLLLTYDRLGLDFPPDAPSDLHGSVHFWTPALVVRGIYPITEQFIIFGELSDGPSFCLLRLWDRIDTYTDFVVRNTLTVGAGLSYGKVEFTFRFKNLFSWGSIARWLTFNVGYYY
jgi:hypothetical protein